jgi:hypothetical protein
MDPYGQVEPPTRRRWHLISGFIVCSMLYVVTVIVAHFWF